MTTKTRAVAHMERELALAVDLQRAADMALNRITAAARQADIAAVIVSALSAYNTRSAELAVRDAADRRKIDATYPTEASPDATPTRDELLDLLNEVAEFGLTRSRGSAYVTSDVIDRQAELMSRVKIANIPIVNSSAQKATIVATAENRVVERGTIRATYYTASDADAIRHFERVYGKAETPSVRLQTDDDASIDRRQDAHQWVRHSND